MSCSSAARSTSRLGGLAQLLAPRRRRARRRGASARRSRATSRRSAPRTRRRRGSTRSSSPTQHAARPARARSPPPRARRASAGSARSIVRVEQVDERRLEPRAAPLARDVRAPWMPSRGHEHVDGLRQAHDPRRARDPSPRSPRGGPCRPSARRGSGSRRRSPRGSRGPRRSPPALAAQPDEDALRVGPPRASMRQPLSRSRGGAPGATTARGVAQAVVEARPVRELERALDRLVVGPAAPRSARRCSSSRRP